MTQTTTRKCKPNRGDSYGNEDFYAYYLNSIKGCESVYDIDRATYSNIIEDAMKMISSAIFSGYEFKIPHIGDISIVKAMPKRFNKKSIRIDFGESKKVGKTVYHTNDHSGGFKYRFMWSKQHIIVRNKSRYEMIFTRENKRELARIIKNKEHDYIEI